MYVCMIIIFLCATAVFYMMCISTQSLFWLTATLIIPNHLNVEALLLYYLR